nr:MAG TPA: hypothetical protein [Caudoviricetes sp.]
MQIRLNGVPTSAATHTINNFKIYWNDTQQSGNITKQ